MFGLPGKEIAMKINITSRDNSWLSPMKATLKANGRQEHLIPLLERALEIARNSRVDQDIKEVFTRACQRKK